MLHAEYLKMVHHVLAFLISLVLRPTVVHSVSVIVNVQVIWHASTSSAMIHAQDHVEPMHNVMLSATLQTVSVQMDSLETHLYSA